MHANTPRNCSCCLFSISVHITCCMTSTNPHGTDCSSLLSEIRTPLCFGMSSLLRQMLSLFSAQPLSCSLLFSQQECCNFLVLGISPRTSWHLTKNLLLSQQDCCCIFFSLSWHLTKSLLASHQDFFQLHLTKSLLAFTKSLFTSRMGAPTCLNQLHEGR
jgi:hypothetical protein